ncbi:MAG TPA: hypothetical protein VJ741_15800, partial [Solirubrobacteraceae bacterium]|nr:hypothetical protein [Solirubrobacteraceae bacterium]
MSSGQRFALIGIARSHSGLCLVSGFSWARRAISQLIGVTTGKNIATATVRKVIRLLMKLLEVAKKFCHRFASCFVAGAVVSYVHHGRLALDMTYAGVERQSP